jgi:hypothetical protein
LIGVCSKSVTLDHFALNRPSTPQTTEPFYEHVEIKWIAVVEWTDWNQPGERIPW